MWQLEETSSAKHSGVLSCSLPLGTAPSPRVIPENPSQKIPILQTEWEPSGYYLPQSFCFWITHFSWHRWLSLVYETHQLTPLFPLLLRCKWSHTVNNDLCVSVKEHGCFNRSFLSLCSLVPLGWEAKSPASSLSSFLIEDKKIPELHSQEYSLIFWKSGYKARGRVCGDLESSQFSYWSLVLLLLHFLRWVFNPLL